MRLAYIVLPLLLAVAGAAGEGGNRGGDAEVKTAQAKTAGQGQKKAKDKDADAEMKTARAKTADGEVTIYYPATFYLSAPKPLEVVVRNTGKMDLRYDSPNPHGSEYRGFIFSAYTEDGKAVPPTRYGEKALSTHRPRWGMGRPGQVRPGQDFEMELDLLRVFDMTVAGKYKLDLRVETFYLRFPGDNLREAYHQLVEFSLNGIQLEVKARPDMDAEKAK